MCIRDSSDSVGKCRAIKYALFHQRLPTLILLDEEAIHDCKKLIHSALKKNIYDPHGNNIHFFLQSADLIMYVAVKRLTANLNISLFIRCFL